MKTFAFNSKRKLIMCLLLGVFAPITIAQPASANFPGCSKWGDTWNDLPSFHKATLAQINVTKDVFNTTFTDPSDQDAQITQTMFQMEMTKVCRLAAKNLTISIEDKIEQIYKLTKTGSSDELSSALPKLFNELESLMNDPYFKALPEENQENIEKAKQRIGEILENSARIKTMAAMNTFERGAARAQDLKADMFSHASSVFDANSKQVPSDIQAPVNSNVQYENTGSDEWEFDEQMKRTVSARIMQYARSFEGSDKNLSFLLSGKVKIKFSQDPSVHIGWFDDLKNAGAIVLNSDFMKQTISELMEKGYDLDQAIDYASLLWIGTAAHETTHATDRANLLRLTGLEAVHYGKESEMHAFSTEVYFLSQAEKLLPKDVWETSMGGYYSQKMAKWHLGTPELRDWVNFAYKKELSIFSDEPDYAIKQLQEGIKHFEWKARNQDDPQMIDYYQGNADQKKVLITLWESKRLREITKNYYQGEIKELERLWPHMDNIRIKDKDHVGLQAEKCAKQLESNDPLLEICLDKLDTYYQRTPERKNKLKARKVLNDGYAKLAQESLDQAGSVVKSGMPYIVFMHTDKAMGYARKSGAGTRINSFSQATAIKKNVCNEDLTGAWEHARQAAAEANSDNVTVAAEIKEFDAELSALETCVKTYRYVAGKKRTDEIARVENMRTSTYEKALERSSQDSEFSFCWLGSLSKKYIEEARGYALVLGEPYISDSEKKIAQIENEFKEKCEKADEDN
ncbi:hypothetical protein ACFL6Y_03985 [Elusimicrobiota bacterium]